MKGNKKIRILLGLVVALGMVLCMTAGFGKKTKAATTVTVTFDSNGGSEVEAQVIEEGGQAVEPEDPTNGDLYFAGWFLNPTADNIVDPETYDIKTFDFDTPVTEDITLTALWVARANINMIGYGMGKINYAAEGEELDDMYGTSIVISSIIGISDTFTIDAKAEEGSKFVKWQKVIVEGETEADSQYEDYSTEPTLKLTITESFDLVAVFEPIEDEKKDDKEEEKEEKEEADDATAGDAKVDAPKADDNLDKTVQTGDHSEPFAAVIVMMASAAATAFFVYKRRQKRDSQ